MEEQTMLYVCNEIKAFLIANGRTLKDYSNQELAGRLYYPVGVVALARIYLEGGAEPVKTNRED